MRLGSKRDAVMAEDGIDVNSTDEELILLFGPTAPLAAIRALLVEQIRKDTEEAAMGTITKDSQSDYISGVV